MSSKRSNIALSFTINESLPTKKSRLTSSYTLYKELGDSMELTDRALELRGRS